MWWKKRKTVNDIPITVNDLLGGEDVKEAAQFFYDYLPEVRDCIIVFTTKNGAIRGVTSGEKLRVVGLLEYAKLWVMDKEDAT